MGIGAASGKKKEKYVELTGITGAGEDYNVYNMKFKEKAMGFFLGFAAGLAGFHIMFAVLPVSIILGIITGFLAYPIYGKYLFKKRSKAMLMQFRDMLDSLVNSFSAGKNSQGAFEDAYSDMQSAYGEEAPITREIGIIVSGLYSNFTIEDLLDDMARRCGLNDIASFADTYSICSRLGGDLKRVVSNTRDIINDKVEIEMEIQTLLSANKNEINIMMVMPFIIIAMMKTLGDEAITGNSPVNVVVKFIALGLFVVAYIIGHKIADIKA